MTKSDKLLLTHFLTRTGMYIYPVNIHTIQSFVTGYETGRKGKCHFYNNCKELLSVKYKIEYSSAGLLGQIKKFSKRILLPEVVAFKKIALEVISINETDTKSIYFYKSAIINVINKIQTGGHPWYNETWKNSWLSLANTKQEWFIQLWGKKELAILKLIDKEVHSNNIVKDHKGKVPSDRMLLLKKKFELSQKL